MFRTLDITSNLKSDILELKKEVSALKNENHLFKVKIRKLQNEINKKDRQIETLINPDKSFFIKKIVSERGASMIITLKDRIKKLEKAINEKDGTIKKLQHDLQTKKLYTLNTADKKKVFGLNPSKHHLSIPFFENECDFDDELRSFQSICKSSYLDNIPNEEVEKSYTRNRRSISADQVKNHKKNVSNNHDVKAQYGGLPRSHLLSIIENLKNNQQRLSPVCRLTDSPDSDIERCELQCETPHPEIQQLQNYFMDILNEMDHLKVTISTLKNDQEKTSDVLKEKNSSIEDLAKEIETLRKPSNKSMADSHCHGYSKNKQNLYAGEITQKSSDPLHIEILQSTTTQSLINNVQCPKDEQNSFDMEKVIID